MGGFMFRFFSAPQGLIGYKKSSAQVLRFGWYGCQLLTGSAGYEKSVIGRLAFVVFP